MSKSKVTSLQQHRVARSYPSIIEREQNVIGNRITEERTRRDLSRPEFGKLLQKVGVNVVTEAIRKWETGASVPNAYQLLAICAVLGIDDVLSAFDSTYTSPLNEEGQRKVREYAEDLAACGKYQPAPVIEFIEMRISNLAVSAGTGAFLEEDSFERHSFPKDSVPSGADFGVVIHGDSMEPRYHDGQIAWVQRCDNLNPGEIGIFLYDGDGYLKQYDERDPSKENAELFVDSEGVLHKQRVLVSLNQKYAPKVVSPNATFRIAGRVLN